MMLDFTYINYLLHKPFHSRKHKLLKRKSSDLAGKLNLYEEVLSEISEYTKEDVHTIEKRRKELISQIDNRNYDSISEEELTRFYIDTDYHLYAAPIWNAECGRIYYLSWILTPYLKKNRFNDILDFGAGAGEVCIMLAKEGFNVNYTDVSKRLIEFSRWRFRKHKLDIKSIDPKDLSSRRFDCVVSFDVFEHLKDLPQKLKDISRLIKKNGALVFNIELSGDGLHLEENKIYNDERKLDKILKDAGLVFSWKFKRFFFYKKI